MNKTACQYAIVRFTPFIETGEFANVGIVMLSAQGGEMGYKLLGRRHKRVSQFFGEIDAAVFKNAMQDLTAELERINARLAIAGQGRSSLTINQKVFAELIRPRETILRFSEPRTVLAEDIHKTLEQLYGYYVGRDFVTKEYQEQKLEKTVKNWLKAADLDRFFSDAKVGDDVYHARFPFVQQEDGRAIKIIKPLSLGHQNTSTKILDHGITWCTRLEALKRRRALPDKVLFTLAGPQFEDAKKAAAYDDVVEMLRDTGACILPSNHQEEIIEFARAG